MKLAILLVCALSGVAHADVGAMVDAGVPSGATVSLVYRTHTPLRLHLGAAHNLIGPGVQGGVTIARRHGVVSPTLTLEGGRFFARDTNAAVERVVGAPTAIAPEELGYDYASAHAGVQIGPFFLHVGVSYLRAAWTTHDTSDDTTTMTAGSASGVVASARLGFVFYL